MHLNFSKLNHFFSLSNDKKISTLFNWGQEFILPLHGKELEKASSELIMYFRNHPEAELCPNLLIPQNYWESSLKEPSHNQINYSFKDFLLNVLVYHSCEYISFNKDGAIFVNPEIKSPRFIQKDSENKKTSLKKTISDSGFTLQQKDELWNGIVIGYLDVKTEETINDKKKKTKKTS